jgi:hypothetical protein
MIVAYELAQLSTTARNLPRAGAALLVLGTYPVVRDDALDFAKSYEGRHGKAHQSIYLHAWPNTKRFLRFPVVYF